MMPETLLLSNLCKCISSGIRALFRAVAYSDISSVLWHLIWHIFWKTVEIWPVSLDTAYCLANDLDYCTTSVSGIHTLTIIDPYIIYCRSTGCAPRYILSAVHPNPRRDPHVRQVRDMFFEQNNLALQKRTGDSLHTNTIKHIICKNHRHIGNHQLEDS